MKISKDQLLAEIKRRAPWYQCISFPEHGVSTTDDPQDAMLDAAWDNKTDEISLEEAARLRPRPKAASIIPLLPPLAGLDILEIGSNCGFFSFEFAKRGARSVIGIDVAPKWLDNAEWARQILGLNNVRFHNCDFMRFDGQPAAHQGLLAYSDATIPMPMKKFDLVFMSTVLDHLFFPLFAIYKMLRISRKWVIIDIPTLSTEQGTSIAHLGIAADGSHHGFTFTKEFLLNFLRRLGVPPEDIRLHLYNRDRNACFIIATHQIPEILHGA